jgi:hypothetical protein
MAAQGPRDQAADMAESLVEFKALCGGTRQGAIETLEGMHAGDVRFMVLSLIEALSAGPQAKELLLSLIDHIAQHEGRREE